MFHDNCRVCRNQQQKCREHVGEVCINTERLYDLPSDDKVCVEITKYSCFGSALLNRYSAAVIARRCRVFG